MSVGNDYELQKMYDQIISVYKLSPMCIIHFLNVFCVCKFSQNGNIIIWQVVQCFSENGMGVIRQRTVKVLVELGKGHRLCLCNLDNDVQDRGNFIHFYSATRVSQQFLVLNDFFFLTQPLRPWRRPFHKAQKMPACTKRQVQVCVSLGRVVFASPSTPEGFPVFLYLALKGTAGPPQWHLQ